MVVVGGVSQNGDVTGEKHRNRQARKSTFVFAFVPRDGSSIAIRLLTTLRRQ
jgi:hypothetical protein